MASYQGLRVRFLSDMYSQRPNQSARRPESASRSSVLYGMSQPAVVIADATAAIVSVLDFPNKCAGEGKSSHGIKNRFYFTTKGTKDTAQRARRVASRIPHLQY